MSDKIFFFLFLEGFTAIRGKNVLPEHLCLYFVFELI